MLQMFQNYHILNKYNELNLNLVFGCTTFGDEPKSIMFYEVSLQLTENSLNDDA